MSVSVSFPPKSSVRHSDAEGHVPQSHPEGGLFQLDGHAPLVAARVGVRGGRLVAQELAHRGRHMVGDGTDPLQV